MSKKYLSLFLLSIFVISGCSNAENDSTESTSTSSTTTTTTEITTEDIDDDFDNDYIEPISSIQDTTVLHAWDWRLNDIKDRLEQIKIAGYNSIQISPMQPKLDKNGWASESTSSQWFKYYQPLAFKVADASETLLGSKDDLIALCSKAKEYNISIIVDVVANHLAGKINYDSQVYDKTYPLHTVNADVDDGSIERVTRGRVGGLPDLDTSDSRIQNDVKNMLCEYLDCGISGFRFDAAKHIETPDDGEFASNFWPNVLNGTTSYAETKGYATPYYYGEILNTCGTNRSYSSYTSMMSVIDNKIGTNVLDAVKNGNTNKLVDYPSGVNADHLMIWAESHDTFANNNGETQKVDYNKINKAFVIQASRKDAASLYYARPSSLSATIGDIYEKGWLDSEIRAVNYFHRIYNKKSENITTTDNCFINVRGENEYAGAVIVNMGNESSKSLTISSLADGEYVNLINNKVINVSNHSVEASFKNGCMIIVPKALDPEIPMEEDYDYSSSIVIKNADENKTYWLWNWTNNNDGHWIKFSQEKNAIGANINNNTNFIIVEANKDVTSMDWSYKIRQTNDLYYDGNQIIYNFDDINWK